VSSDVESRAKDGTTIRSVLQPILAVLGVVLLGILTYDVAGYRLLNGQRYCQYAFAPIDDFEGAGSTTIDVADTGSGCMPGVEAVCRVSRLLFDDVDRGC
jgi:hypothetical protein